MTIINKKYENFNYLTDVVSLLLTGFVIHITMKAAMAWVWRKAKGVKVELIEVLMENNLSVEFSRSG